MVIVEQALCNKNSWASNSFTQESKGKDHRRSALPQVFAAR
jgi:hypothetical protein